MDSSDPTIVFDNRGNCNYCEYALQTMDDRRLRGAEGRQKLDESIALMKRHGRNKKYDCIIGLSGGLDSCYLAYFMKKHYDLSMLALHVETGWNSDIARDNIRKLCDRMQIDLVVATLVEREFMDLQRAYFLSGVTYLDVPQDHTFIAYLFRYAKDNGIRYILSGANFSTENILQKGEGGVVAADKVNLLDIHKTYGSVDLKTLPTISLFERYIKYRFINRITMVRPLDLIDYQVDVAIRELKEAVDFVYYGGKHHESIFTRFYQTYYLPKKLGYDKRRSHLSSLVVTNQLSREQALQILEQPLYDVENMEKDIEFIIARMGITREDFKKVMNQPVRSCDEFRMSKWNVFRDIAVRLRIFLGE